MIIITCDDCEQIIDPLDPNTVTGMMWRGRRYDLCGYCLSALPINPGYLAQKVEGRKVPSIQERMDQARWGLVAKVQPAGRPTDAPSSPPPPAGERRQYRRG